MKYFPGHFASNHETPAKQKFSQPKTAKLTTLTINSTGPSIGFEGLKFSTQEFKFSTHQTAWIYMNTCESKCSLCPQGSGSQEAVNKTVCGHVLFALPLLTTVKLHSPHRVTLSKCFPFWIWSLKQGMFWIKKLWLEGGENSMKHTIEGNLHCPLSFWCDSEWMHHEDLFLWYLHRPAPRCTATWPTELHQPLYVFATWKILLGPLIARMCLPLLMSHLLLRLFHQILFCIVSQFNLSFPGSFLSCPCLHCYCKVL